TVELFPRSGDYPKNIVDTFQRIIEIQDRVKVTRQAVGNIYQFAVFANWLSRFFLKLADPSPIIKDQLRSDGVPVDEENVAREVRSIQNTVLRAAEAAMSDYFGDSRPGRALPGEVNADCSVNTNAL